MNLNLALVFGLISVAVQPALAVDCSKAPGRIEDVGVANLEMLAAEVEQGKRDDRDSYIILNQLLFMYRVRHQDETPHGRRVQALHSELAKKHPDFSGMNDWRLSETISCDEEKKRQEAELAAKRRAEEERPRPGYGRMLIHGSKMALHTDHPKSLRFFDIPADHAVLCVEESGDFRDQRSPGASGGACAFAFCAAKDVTPLAQREGYSPDVRLVSCKHPVRPEPKRVVPLLDWVVVKSPGYVNLNAPFFLATTEFRGSGEGGPVTPKEPFARIYSIDGKVLHDFNVKSEPPNSVVSGLGADKTGAVIGLGEFVTFDNGCDNETSPKKMRKLFLWESSGEAKAIESLARTPELDALMARFRIHESYMPWFKWKQDAADSEAE